MTCFRKHIMWRRWLFYLGNLRRSLHSSFHQPEGHGVVRGEGPVDVWGHPRLRAESARHEGQLLVRRAYEGRVRTGNAGRQVRRQGATEVARLRSARRFWMRSVISDSWEKTRVATPTGTKSRDVDPLMRMSKAVFKNGRERIVYVMKGWNRFKASCDEFMGLFEGLAGYRLVVMLPQSGAFVQAGAVGGPWSSSTGAARL